MALVTSNNNKSLITTLHDKTKNNFFEYQINRVSVYLFQIPNLRSPHVI